jgi:hypothetical protein
LTSATDPNGPSALTGLPGDPLCVMDQSVQPTTKQPTSATQVRAPADLRHLSEHHGRPPRHGRHDVTTTAALTQPHVSHPPVAEPAVARLSGGGATAAAGARMEALRAVMERLERDNGSAGSAAAAARTVVLTFANMGYKVGRPFPTKP